MQFSRHAPDATAKRGFMMGSDASGASGVWSGIRSLQNPPASLEGFGEALFKGAIAVPYLKKQGLSENVLETSAWTQNGLADKVCGK
jgi:hypothetical protein